MLASAAGRGGAPRDAPLLGGRAQNSQNVPSVSALVASNKGLSLTSAALGSWGKRIPVPRLGMEDLCVSVDSGSCAGRAVRPG